MTKFVLKLKTLLNTSYQPTSEKITSISIFVPSCDQVLLRLNCNTIFMYVSVIA